MKSSELLIKAKAIILAPAHWTQNAFARDELGNTTDELASDAVCFCSLGALYKAQSNTLITEEWQAAKDYINRSIRATEQYLGVAGYNDTHTHAEVLAKFDAAITLAQEESN